MDTTIDNTEKSAPLLSIIIPVYNVQDYMEECLDSILNQKHDNCEIILVNDGSTDNSYLICEKYAKKYNEIKLINQTNMGLSGARNTGIKEAKGKYILFVDSDDWLMEGCLEDFLLCIIEYSPDIMIGKAKVIDELGNTKDKVRYQIKKGMYCIDDYLKMLLLNRCYIACAPFAIYSREMIENNKIEFKPGIVHEDELWMTRILTAAKSVYYTDEYFYFNRIRIGSITHSNNKNRRGNDLLIVAREMQDILSKCDAKETRILKNKMVVNYLNGMCMVDEKREEFISFGLLMKYAYYRKLKIKVLIYKILPRLYRWRYEVKN